jgi:uncharacterized iron-regulated membrane protein
MEKPIRPLLRRIHLWITLVVGLPVALISATGLPISYWYESDALFSPGYYRGQQSSAARASFEQLATGARSVPGVASVDSLYLLPRFHTAQASVHLGDGRSGEVSLDLASGKVLGVRDLDRTAMSWIYDFHTRLLLDRAGAGNGGKLCIRIFAACLLALVLTGMWLWWPARLSWSLFSPAVRRRTLWRDLHLKLGIYVLPVLAIVGSSAFLLSIETTRGIGSRHTLARMPDLAHKSSSSISNASLDALAERGRFRSGTFHVAGVFGIDGAAPIAVLSSDAREEEDYWVSVDRGTGLPLQVSSSNPLAADENAGFLIGLHQGRHWGTWGQRIFAVGSCVPLILYLSGLIMWIRRTPRGPR